MGVDGHCERINDVVVVVVGEIIEARRICWESGIGGLDGGSTIRVVSLVAVFTTFTFTFTFVLVLVLVLDLVLVLVFVFVALVLAILRDATLIVSTVLGALFTVRIGVTGFGVEGVGGRSRRTTLSATFGKTGRSFKRER